MTSKQSLLSLLKTYSVLRGDFTLASGKKTNVYVDVRITALRSDGINAIGNALFNELQLFAPNVRYVGGLALGAVPIITAIAYQAGLNDINDFHSVIVRKEAKMHGTGNLVEPNLIPPHGTELVAIDDVVTTAGSTIKAINSLRDVGYTINHALSIIDREAGGANALNDVDVELHSLFKLSEVVD